MADDGLFEEPQMSSAGLPASSLAVEPGEALLCLQEAIFDQNGHPLHTSHQVIRGDRFTFRI